MENFREIKSKVASLRKKMEDWDLFFQDDEVGQELQELEALLIAGTGIKAEKVIQPEEAVKKAFQAGQEWIWEDLEQTQKCSKYDSYEDYLQQNPLKL